MCLIHNQYEVCGVEELYISNVLLEKLNKFCYLGDTVGKLLYLVLTNFLF